MKNSVLKKSAKITGLVIEGALALVGLGVLATLGAATLCNDERRQQLLSKCWDDEGEAIEPVTGDCNIEAITDIKENTAPTIEARQKPNPYIKAVNDILTNYEIKNDNIWYDIFVDENGEVIFKKAQNE